MSIILSFTFVDKKQNVVWNQGEQTFDSLEDAKDYLKEEYGGNTKRKMYVDKLDGSSKHIGYVFSRWNHYHDNGKRYPEDVWVDIGALTFNRVDLRPSVQSMRDENESV